MSVDITGGATRSAFATLQGRITAVAMVTAVVVLFAACVVFTAEQWHAERRNLEENQRQLTGMLAAPLARAAGDPVKVHRLMAGFSAAGQVRDAELLDPRGALIDSYHRQVSGPFTNPTLIETRTPVVTVAGAKLGELVVRRDIAFFGQLLARYLAVAAALLFAAAGLSLFLGRAMARRVAEPIARLAQAMHQLSLSGDFSTQVTQTSDDELGRLTQSFNTLLKRLKVNDDELRGAMVELTQARDAAEAANVQKSQFLANMSHEIRTPLNGVLAMAQIMALGDMTGDQRERLTVIRKSGEALLEILNDILDVSKIEAGKLELDILEFDLEQTVQSALDGFIGVAGRKGLALDLDIAPAAGTRLGDAARLRQIIVNLISNALKFTFEGGVSVKVDGVGEDGADGIKIVVRDTGIGMPAEKLPMLFQKFTQLDASTTRQFGGTGLGLSICHELTTLMGGEVQAESVEGAGSTFTVLLPLVRVAAAKTSVTEADEQNIPDNQGRVLRVLAAEDNPTNQMVLSTIIQIFGAELVLVDNGQAAVEAWEVGDYDVILMDIQMPVLDGIGATRAIRAAELAQHRSRTPIIALSANAMVHQVTEYMAVGMDGHVAKPIELPKLHAALEGALASREASRATFAA